MADLPKIREEDLKGDCYRLNRVLQLLFSLVGEGAAQAASSGSTVVLGGAQLATGKDWRTPVGEIDGVVVDYVIEPPVSDGYSLLLVLNGVMQNTTDVTLVSTKAIRYTVAPRPGDWHRYVWMMTG